MSELGPIDEYRDLFENAPCGYLTIGSDGRLTKVNATLTAWTGFEADKFIGRRLHQFLNMAGRIYYETHIARETAELREQFIAVLGHDLRNPLAAISAGARILQRSGALQQHQELRVLDMINTTVTRMSDLIDNVLDFARGRLGGGITLSRDAHRPLEPVLEQVVDELRTASSRRVIETSFEITEPVNCDRTRIGQLLSNLIGNALTHGAARLDVASTHDETRFVFTMPLTQSRIVVPR
jgi:signal transduction histidine kinase